MQAGKPLRLLMMTDTAILGSGGSERFLRNLLSRLPAQRYTIDVLQLAPPPPAGQQVAQLDNRAVRLLHQPIDAIYAPRGLAAFRRVRERVARGDYDIVQSHHEKSDLICAFLPRMRGVRRISNRRDMGFQKTRRVRSVFRHANARFDRIVAPSRSILDALVKDENANRARCLAIPNGVDTSRFRPVDVAERERLRAALGFGADECLIGCVASFTPVKCHDTLIDAFARVRREHPQARLLLVGAGPLRNAIEAQVGAAGLDGAVRLLGARADVENILPALDLFALSSSTEGLSNAILEAQACGLPVVATDVGGNADLVQPPGSGILVPPRHADAFAQGLAELIREPQRRRACGDAARQRIESEYSLAAMSAAYERLYLELANER